MDDSLRHHQRLEYCTTRLKYRQGRQLKAVKVYSVVSESKHLLVFGVPKINLQQELKRTFQRYGPLEFITCMTDELSAKIELERFTDAYHVKFRQLANARRAKRFLDAKEYYGGILHISYAPEYETIAELREKFQQRQQDVRRQIHINTKRLKPALSK